MLAMEEVLSELNGEELNEQGLPPGFRFHPTDEELITFYLASKVFKGSFCGVEIAEVDLNRCEPWELPDVAKMGEREWYFYSLRDRKYPTGLRTNRATGAGYWKATGKDREVYSASSGALLGMKKTLVFYKGRAPRGEKTKWVMHEYRLDGDFSYRHAHAIACKEEWVICRIFRKNGEKKNQIFSSCQTYLLESGLSPNSLPALLETSYPNTLIECHSSQAAAMLHHQSFQTPFQIHHYQSRENDLKALVSSVMSQSQSHCHLISSSNNPFQLPNTPISINPNNNMNPINIIPDSNNNKVSIPPSSSSSASSSSSSSSSLLPSIDLFKSLISHHHHHHQDYSAVTPPKQQPDMFKQFKAEPSFSHFQLPTGTNDNTNFMDIIKIQPNPPPYQHQQHPLVFEMECSNSIAAAAAAAAADVSVQDMSTSIMFNRPGFQFQTMLDPHISIIQGESWP